jgi:predicted aspartyl protease
MKKFPRTLAFIAINLLSALSTIAAETAPLTGGTLRDFFASHDYAGVKMERQFNTPFIHAKVNEKPAILVIATNCAISGIDRGSRAKFGFSERKMTGKVEGTFGLTNERYGLTQLNRLDIGGNVFTNFPAAVVNLTNLARGPNIGHADGVLGRAEMRRYGAVIDFGQQMFYINRAGSDGSVTETLKSLLRNHGFIRIPMTFSSRGQFEVSCRINNRPTKMTVDTAAFFTILKMQTAKQTGVPFAPSSMNGNAAGGVTRRLNTGTIRDFVVGEYRTANANVAVVNALFDCLGVNYLSERAAIIDTKGANLYLRLSR